MVSFEDAPIPPTFSASQRDSRVESCPGMPGGLRPSQDLAIYWGRVQCRGRDTSIDIRLFVSAFRTYAKSAWIKAHGGGIQHNTRCILKYYANAIKLDRTIWHISTL